MGRPFDYPELRARIAAQYRRHHHRSGEVFRVRALEIDTRRRLVLLAGEPIGLTRRVFTLLAHLAREPERVFPKSELEPPPVAPTMALGHRAIGRTLPGEANSPVNPRTTGRVTIPGRLLQNSILPSRHDAPRVFGNRARLALRKVSYPRRQQLRRLTRAVDAAAGSIAAMALGVIAASGGLGAVAAVLLFTAAGLMLYARHWARSAGRSRVGAHSEKHVQRALALLEEEGWRVRRSLAWRPRGDIDHVVIAPTGVAFAIETKTRTYDYDHLALARAQSAWLRRHRRRWCPRGAIPILCVVRAYHLEQIQAEVVVSADRLVGALRAVAGAAPRPRFLAPLAPRHGRVA